MNIGIQPDFKGVSRAVFFCRNAGSPRSGAALVLVLLLTGILVLAITLFLSLSSRNVSLSSSVVKEEEVGDASELVWRLIVSNLQREMLAGSINPQAPQSDAFVSIATPEGQGRLLFPANAQASAPFSNATEDQPNLVKWSSSCNAFFEEAVPGTYPWASTFPPALAAAPVSSGGAASDGKTVAPGRWNATGLLSEFKPVPSPDWCYINVQGEPRVNLLTNKVVPVSARYAYMIFDEGGLANVSVAGFPSRLDPMLIASKASPRLIDLRPLLVEAEMSEPQAAAFNDALVQWRDSGSLKGGRYVLDLLQQPFGVPGRLISGNRAWSGRVGLIRMVRDFLPGPAVCRKKFLQYAGTFSRSLEQPSLQPVQPGSVPGLPPAIRGVADGGNDGVGWDAARINKDPKRHLNPPFLQVRVVVPFIRFDGTPARAGEALVKRRFALNRLALVGHQATAGSGSEIEKYFGLTRDSLNEPWIYRAGQNKIKTLYEVANPSSGAAREPDFMELLKASVYAGALAPGNAMPREEWEVSLDGAIIQIAANLIDQADEDDFPTRISFDNGTGAHVFCGVENLPYFQGVSTCVSNLENQNFLAPFLPPEGGPAKLFVPGSSGAPVNDTMVWQKVQFWNPHAQGSSGGGTQQSPRIFRLVVGTDKEFALTAKQDAPMLVAMDRLPSVAEDSAAENLKPEGEQFRFEVSKAGVGSFQNPLWIDTQSALPEVKVIAGDGNGLFPQGELLDFEKHSFFGVGIAALHRAYPASLGPHHYWVLPSSFVVESPPRMTYRLEYLAADSVSGKDERWVAYDEKQVAFEPEIFLPPLERNAIGPMQMFPDPRTGRLGAVLQNGNQSVEQLRTTYYVNAVADSGCYRDADGVFRRAMGASARSAGPLEDVARPRILNRAFRSVGEMAFASSGNPWKQLDFGTPESGYAGLLDVFCVSDFEAPAALAAGRFNLNTRQLPVLKAALAGAARTVDSGVADPISISERDALAAALLARTTRQPLRNISELCGSWKGNAGSGGALLGSQLYDGFAADIGAGFVGEEARQSAVRALAELGDARVWNLLIDVIVQSGRFPQYADSRGNMRGFTVQAERRLWVHVAIDRLTGQVLDTQVEVPAE